MLPALNAYRLVLGNRPFRLLWTNQILLQLSFHMVNFSLVLRAWQLTQSNTATGLVIVALVLPAILFGVFAGIFADTIDRKRIIVVTTLLLTASFLSFAFIRDILGIVLFVAFLMSSINQFFMPAEAAAIPMLVKKKELLAAQSLFALTLYATFLLGYAIAGPLMIVFGNDVPFFIAAIAVAIGSFLVLRLPSLAVRVQERGDLFSRTKTQILESIAFIQTHRFVSVPILLLTILQMAVGIVASLTPGFMVRVVDVSEKAASLIVMLPTGIGMVVGAILIGQLTKTLARRIVVARAIMIAGFVFLLMTLSPLLFVTFLHIQLIVPPLLFFLSILLGGAAASVQVISMTVLQEHTPLALKGRVFATLNMAISGVALIPVMLAAGVADLVGLVPVLLTVGSFVVLVGLIASRTRFVREHVLNTT
ncbi:MAG: MFS transporter [bacterium]|nr:MFS transporter [bacterium]